MGAHCPWVPDALELAIEKVVRCHVGMGNQIYTLFLLVPIFPSYCDGGPCVHIGVSGPRLEQGLSQSSVSALSIHTANFKILGLRKANEPGWQKVESTGLDLQGLSRWPGSAAALG